MQRYGYGAMDLAGRGAAAQMGSAATQLSGLNPAARAAALAQMAQAGGGALGQAGLQGMLAGGQLLQGAGQANLQAQLQNLLSQRGTASEMIGRSLGLGAGVGQAALGTASAYDQMMQQYLLQRKLMEYQQQMQDKGLLGDLGNILGQVGSFIPGGNLFGGGGQAQQYNQIPSYIQQPYVGGYPALPIGYNYY
jgi:hypothetical protein